MLCLSQFSKPYRHNTNGCGFVMERSNVLKPNPYLFANFSMMFSFLFHCFVLLLSLFDHFFKLS